MSQNINSFASPMKTNTSSFIQTGFFLVVCIGLLLWTNHQQKKREEKKKSMLMDLQVGDVIQTYGGVVGTITFIAEDRRLIEIKTGINLSSKISINIQAVEQKLDNSSVVE